MRELIRPLPALAAMALTACQPSPETPPQAPVSAPADLARHSAEFTRRVVEVTDGVHVAIGYGLANSIMLEGSDGIIIVDTMETVEEGRSVLAAFREITSKPVRAIIYTHNHADHVMGARAFGDDPDLPVYAHASTAGHIDRILNVLRPIITVRSMRMFGNYLDPAGLVNAGIGPRLGLDPGDSVGILRPNRVFEDVLEDEVAGIRFRLEHAPGETSDQLLVWLPQNKVLLSGDNLYKAFPNLYTIRGTAYRDVLGWIGSLDRMRELAPEHLVPSHTGPLSGVQQIQSVLLDYRDAIQFVHDQTIRGINHGMTPDELVEVVRLPANLAASPYLQEFYGTVPWSVRSIFDGNLGWFDGNPTTLNPLPPTQHAQHLAALAGGEQALREHAHEAARKGDHQWLLELSDALLQLRPGDAEIRQRRSQALRALGESQANPNARHYYLSSALELEQDLQIGRDNTTDLQTLASFPMAGFFRGLAVNLNPEKSRGKDIQVGFRFPDTGETWSVHVRNQIADTRPGLPPNPELTVSVDSLVWKAMLAGQRNAALTIASDMEIQGSTMAFLGFMGLFRDQD
jgi:alkyl sulfatase BDS1-like metallo-beta-lactamase superfamily hydrolase